MKLNQNRGENKLALIIGFGLLIFIFASTGFYLLNSLGNVKQIDKEAQKKSQLNDEVDPTEIIKSFGFIRSISDDSLEFDEAEMLSGDDAIQKGIEDTGCKEEEIYNCIPSLNNDFYIRNKEKTTKKYQLGSEIKIIRTSDFETGEREMPLDEFKNIFTGQNNELSWLKNIPFHIEASGNTIIRITEQYIP